MKRAFPIVEIINNKQMVRVAEIGVMNGAIVEYVLDRCPTIKEYWAVDSWTNYEGYEQNFKKDDVWEGKHLHVCSLMKRYPNLKVVKDFSVNAASIFEPGYFDLVFIDANHLYDYVIKDLDVWFELVKKDGVICGHDYERRHKDVVRAVNEKFGNKVKRGPGKTWFYGETGKFSKMKRVG
jgi:predicted O-methyltransferase YrrM